VDVPPDFDIIYFSENWGKGLEEWDGTGNRALLEGRILVYSEICGSVIFDEGKVWSDESFGRR